MKFLRVFLAMLVVSAAFAACKPANDPPPQANHRVYRPNVDSTGASDVSAAMAAFLAGVPNGSTIELRPGGRYRMDQTFLIARRSSLNVLGNGATFFFSTAGDRSTDAAIKATRARPNVRVLDSTSISISNLNVIGANPLGGRVDDAYQANYEAQHGFDVLNSVGVSLINDSATDTYGDFVYIGGGYGRDSRASNIVVRGFRGTRSGRQGITMTEASHILIENSTLTDLRRATFDMEPESDAASIDDVTIRNNTIGGGRLNFVAAKGHGPIDDVTIQNNKLVGLALSVQVQDLDGGWRRNWRVIGNSSNLPAGNPQFAVMSFWKVDGIWVQGNTQQMALREGPGGPGPRMYLAAVAASNNVNISGNTVLDGAGDLRPY